MVGRVCPVGRRRCLPAHGERGCVVRRALFRGHAGARYPWQGASLMGALRRRAALLAVLLSFAAGPCFAREGAPWRDHVTAAAARFGLPEEWVLRVIAAESGGRTELGGRPITSHAGAMGLMQVMPATWASLRARYRL